MPVSRSTIAGMRLFGRDLQEVRLELVILADVDRMRGVGQAHFFEGDGGLAAVRCGPGVEVDHPYLRERRERRKDRLEFRGEAQVIAQSART